MARCKRLIQTDVGYIAPTNLYFHGQTMSHDPYHSNPYTSPATEIYQDGPSGNPLIAPAVILLVLASLMLLLLLLSLPEQLVRIQRIDTTTPRGQGEMVGSVVSLLVWFIMTGGVIYGSISMLRLRGYGSAMTAAVFAVIPICSPLFVLGIPFGIWAIIVLNRYEVKARFR